MKFYWDPIGDVGNGPSAAWPDRGISNWSEKMSNYLYEYPMRKPDSQRGGVRGITLSSLLA